MKLFASKTILLAVLLAPEARAAVFEYPLAVPNGGGVSFEIPFAVEHPGEVVVEASWTGSRVLAFRLDGPPSAGPPARRSGPSPPRLESVSDDATLADGSMWTLSIRAIATGRNANGVVLITVPDPPEEVAAREAALKPPPPPEPVPDPWTQPVGHPEGAPAAVARFYEGVDRLRSLVFGDDPFTVRDGCGWQAELVRWLADRRDSTVPGSRLTEPETSRFLARLARAVRSVEEMRTSSSPILAGPVPQGSLRRRAWLAARLEAVRPIERELDALSERLRGDEIPELDAERWPARFVACLTAAERAFEASVRLASDSPSGGDLTNLQWERMLAAAGAFESLTELEARPPAP